MSGQDRNSTIDWNEIRERLAGARERLAQSWTPSEGEQRRILRARAAELAREPLAQSEPGSQIEVIAFHLARERYAVETAFVREVASLRDLTPVPCAPSFVLGIISVRGQILSVIDLRRFFDLPVGELNELNKAIILRAREMELGVLAEEVVGARQLPLAELQPALPTLVGIHADYIRGVTGDRVVVLDAERILRDPTIIVREEVADG